MTRLSGKVAVITGGSAIIGKVVLAQRFLQEKAKVVLVDLFQDVL